MKDYCIYLDEPALSWEHGTPIGNGSIGAMIYGGVRSERVQFSYERIWSGDKINTDNEHFREIIDETRKLLLAGDGPAADAYCARALKNSFHRIKSQETACELVLEFPETDISGYRRELFLNSGKACVSYKSGGTSYKREYFASYPDKLVCIKLKSGKSAGLSFKAHIERYDKNDPKCGKLLNVQSIDANENSLTMNASTAYGGHEFKAVFRFVISGSALRICNNEVCVDNADSCCIYVSVAMKEENINEPEYDWDKLSARHEKDFRSLMERADITLGCTMYGIDKMPFSTRLNRLKNGAQDPGLLETYFQFGRYLLISSSRPGTLPANLQGVWNDYINAPWNSDYHTNINLQMNYWPSEVTNLSECEEPLNDYINAYLLKSGKRCAEVNYKCRGAVLHHLSDIYGFAAPADGLWGLWPLGGAWLCYHLWEHYLYGEDKAYLKEHSYEYIRECTRFFLDYMFKDEKGRLLSGPSTSPENTYYCNGKRASLCLSPSMDIEIISGLHNIFINAAKLLDTDHDMIQEVQTALSEMPPLRVGKHGQLMEWLEDYDEPEPGHRHISHLFGLYPGNYINSETPDLLKAAEKALKRRLEHGGGHTGWSAAWLISLHARLRDREGVYNMIHKLLSASTHENLLDFHPPFQIDGNFGGTAGIAEMLIQSHEGRISLLPALPKQFPNGEFHGLKARTCAEVDCEWRNGHIRLIKIHGKPNTVYRLEAEGNIFDALTDVDGEYEISF